MRSPLSPWVHTAAVFLALQVPAMRAFIRAVCGHNAAARDFEALPALFGEPVPPGGLAGSLVEARPPDACRPIAGPPNSSAASVVLIARYGCSFATKVLHAQEAGFRAAVVHNVGSQTLVHMVSERGPRSRIRIPAVFTTEATAKTLKRLRRAERLQSLILVPEYFHFVWKGSSGSSARAASPPPPCQSRVRLRGPAMHTVSFYAYWVVCAPVSILIAALLIEKRLSRRPGGKLRRGHGGGRGVSLAASHYQECAICLEKYAERDSVKVLSCSHAFHSRCIDLWHITQARSKTCPLCMQKVMVVTRLQAARLWRDAERDSEWTVSLRKGRAASKGQRCFRLLSQQLPSQF